MKTLLTKGNKNRSPIEQMTHKSKQTLEIIIETNNAAFSRGLLDV
jgi:hypothetical protein